MNTEDTNNSGTNDAAGDSNVPTNPANPGDSNVPTGPIGDDETEN